MHSVLDFKVSAAIGLAAFAVLGCDGSGIGITSNTDLLFDAKAAGTPEFSFEDDLAGDMSIAPDLVITDLSMRPFARSVTTKVQSQGNPFALVDMNRDGKLDLVLVGFGLTWVATCLGDGTGTFGPPIFTETGANISAAAFVDFNGDGLTDVALCQYQQNGGLQHLLLRLGRGNGMFGGGSSIDLPQCSGLAAGDLNGDGRTDVVAKGNGTLQSFIYVGAAFMATSTTRTDNVGSIVAGDLNKDGQADIVMSGSDTPELIPFLSSGQGVLSAGKTVGTLSSHDPLSAADMTGDGQLDIVAADASARDVEVFPGDGQGGLGAPTTTPIQLPPVSLAIADFDGDGTRDFAVALRGSTVVYLYAGTGGARFAVDGALLSKFGAIAEVLAGDLNNDGKPDVLGVWGDNLGTSVTVWLN